MKYSEKFPMLNRFFFNTFHVDWQDFHENEASAIKEVVYETGAQYISDVIKDLNHLIALDLKEPELCKAVCDDLGCDYYPDTEYKDINDWLRSIRNTMAKYAAEKAAQENPVSSVKRD